MSATPAVLGVDFGTSHTVATVRMPGGRIESLLFDASPLLPSAVFAQPGGELLVGHDALRGSRLDPGRLEPHPKRHIDDGTLLLGEVETTVEEAIRAVLARVARAGRQALGADPGPVVLTHPAGWGAQRRGVLARAATGAGLGEVRLVAEPVAAALYFTEVLGHPVRPGGTLVVYDLGGGTFDISAVRRRADGGWEVLAAAGLDDVGGVDIDAAVVDWMVTRFDLTAPGATPGAGDLDDRTERRRWQQVRQEARAAKEQLSRVASAPIVLPGLDRDGHLTRDEFDELARPLLARTVALTTSTLFASGVAADGLVGVFLVGGSSRIPLVATLLHRALGVAPTVIDQPELVVAHGSLCALPPGAETGAGTGPATGANHPAPAAPDPPRRVAGPAPNSRGTTAPVSPVTTAVEPVVVEPVAVEVPTARAGRAAAGFSRPSRRSIVNVAVVALLGVLVGTTMTAFPLVATYDGPLPHWADRYAWQLLPVAGLLAGLWTRQRGSALAAQAVSGVVAGFVGLAMEHADRTIFRLPWGIPIEFYYWEHNPDIWFVALVGGCLAAGLTVEVALAATARLGGPDVSAAMPAAVATTAGMLASPLLLWILNWEYHPQLSREVIDTLFAYPFILALAWFAARIGRRPAR